MLYLNLPVCVCVWYICMSVQSTAIRKHRQYVGVVFNYSQRGFRVRSRQAGLGLGLALGAFFLTKGHNTPLRCYSPLRISSEEIFFSCACMF